MLLFGLCGHINCYGREDRSAMSVFVEEVFSIAKTWKNCSASSFAAVKGFAAALQGDFVISLSAS
jgi:hypothetical protein